MRPTIFTALLCALPLGLPAEAAVTITDDSGRVLTLPAPARRIVSLAPHATELLFAAGAGERVVGVSAFSDFPDVARVLPQVSGGVRLDIEQVLALKPDLAIGWMGGNAAADLERLRRLGIPVFIAEPRKLDDVATTLIRLGQLVGTEAQAESAAGRYRTRLAGLRDRYRDRGAPVRTFVMVSAQPLITLNHAHLLQDVLTLCGGRNIFAAAEMLATSVSVESVVLEDPDAILFSDTLGTSKAMSKWWAERAELRAVRQGHVYPIPASQTLRQTPRILDGAQQVCEALAAARATGR